MPETGPRIPDPRGQEQPRVASAAIPAADQHPNGKHPDGKHPDGKHAPGHPVGQPVQSGQPELAAAAPAPADGSSRRTRKTAARTGGSPLFLWLKEVATIALVAIVLSFLIKTFLIRAFYSPSESMVHTLDVNDRIFVNLLVPEPFALQRGDVVVFKDTKGWLAPAAERPEGPFSWVQDGLMFVGLLPDNSQQHLVKRVIGLPGDHIACCDAGGRLSVNGTPLDEEYVNPAEVPQASDFDVVVPPGKLWVMGDNRNHSADSRAHLDSGGGFVDLADVEGKAAVIAWPLNRMSVLDNYPDVFRDVPAPESK